MGLPLVWQTPTHVDVCTLIVSLVGQLFWYRVSFHSLPKLRRWDQKNTITFRRNNHISKCYRVYSLRQQPSLSVDDPCGPRRKNSTSVHWLQCGDQHWLFCRLPPGFWTKHRWHDQTLLWPVPTGFLDFNGQCGVIVACNWRSYSVQWF